MECVEFGGVGDAAPVTGVVRSFRQRLGVDLVIAHIVGGGVGGQKRDHAGAPA